MDMSAAGTMGASDASATKSAELASTKEKVQQHLCTCEDSSH